jgi:hypothetical protein
MKSITEYTHQIAMSISDHGNIALSKGLQYFGVGGSSVGIASGVAKMNPSEVESVLQLSDYGAIIGIIGGLTLIVKNGVDIYFTIKKNKREEK